VDFFIRRYQMERRAFIKAWSACAAAAGGSLIFSNKILAKTGTGTSPDIDCKELTEKALKYFTQENRACSESVLLAGSECLGVKSDFIPGIATGLAGGIGMQGKTCGAVTGAAMVLSLAAAQKKDPMAKMKTMEAVGRLYTNIEKKIGTASCREITGVDLTKPEGKKEIQGLKESKCVPALQAAAELLVKELADF
jgi:C_GCAxxG_C_C family probable redox protein